MCKDDNVTAAAMRAAARMYDDTRPITMNHIVSAEGALPYLDVQENGAVESVECTDPRDIWSDNRG